MESTLLSGLCVFQTKLQKEVRTIMMLEVVVLLVAFCRSYTLACFTWFAFLFSNIRWVLFGHFNNEQ